MKSILFLEIPMLNKIFNYYYCIEKKKLRATIFSIENQLTKEFIFLFKNSCTKI